jgi:ABC-2 type transport system ATP-binding protein
MSVKCSAPLPPGAQRSMPDTPAVRVRDLTRTFSAKSRRGSPSIVTALDGVTLDIPRGELIGVLGPNGAGKTTLIKILTTLLAPSSGVAEVSGFDVVTQSEEVRTRINMVAGGESSGYGLLTVRENLWMFAQFYGIPSKDARKRIDELLERMGMTDRAGSKMSTLSTGQRQKINIIRGFLTDPSVLFLDEPTLGLDVNAARDVRTLVRDWMAEDRSRTLLLTTHYMMEADELCDRVAIVNHGRMLACDTPERLKEALRQRIVYHLAVTPIGANSIDALRAVPGVISLAHVSGDGRSILEVVLEREDILGALLATLSSRSAKLLNLATHEATLEDVFVKLVGRSMKEEEE